MITLCILFILTTIIFTAQFFNAREGYYMKSFLISLGYTVMGFLFKDSTLLFFAIMYVSVALWVLTFVSVNKKTSFNKRFVRRHEKKGTCVEN